MIAEMRKKEFMDNKILKLRMEHERRMAEEEAIKHKKELEVLNMEKLEMELTRKLQHTQLLQKAAYEELETALAQPPEEFSRKYGGIKEGGSPYATMDDSRNSPMRNSYSGTKSSKKDDVHRLSYDEVTLKPEKIGFSEAIQQEQNEGEKQFVTEVQKNETDKITPLEEEQTSNNVQQQSQNEIGKSD